MVLLRVAVNTATARHGDHDLQAFRQEDQYAEAVRALFHDMALASGNRILAGFVESLSDRLHQMRTNEHLVFEDLNAELTAMRESCSLQPAAAKHALAAYHDRRLRMARRLAAFLP